MKASGKHYQCRAKDWIDQAHFKKAYKNR